MELSSSNIKRLLIFSYISRNGTFQPKLENNKKIHRKKISFASGKWNFLTLILKISYIFSKESFSYILQNGNPEKILIFQETETLKNFVYFRK